MLRRRLVLLFAGRSGRNIRAFFSPSCSSHSSSSIASCYSFSHSTSNAATTTAAGTGEEDLLFTSSKAAAAATAPSVLQPGVVIYDGVCHLCHKDEGDFGFREVKPFVLCFFKYWVSGVRWVIKADKDKKLKFCCVQSRAAEPYLRLCGLDREDVLRRFLFVEGPILYHQASTAALKVASYLPLPYSMLSALLVIPSPLRDAVYDYVAKRRYDWFGKEDDCIVIEEKEMLERFIDWEEMLDRQKSKPL